jgi:hypothetical protein
MVFSRTILGFIISKEGKVMETKKVEALESMPPKKSKFSMGWHNL